MYEWSSIYWSLLRKFISMISRTFFWWIIFYFFERIKVGGYKKRGYDRISTKAWEIYPNCKTWLRLSSRAATIMQGRAIATTRKCHFCPRMRSSHSAESARIVAPRQSGWTNIAFFLAGAEIIRWSGIRVATHLGAKMHFSKKSRRTRRSSYIELPSWRSRRPEDVASDGYVKILPVWSWSWMREFWNGAMCALVFYFFFWLKSMAIKRGGMIG